MTQNEFKNTIKKVQGKREHKVTGSIGVYDVYKIIRKNKWFNIGRPLKEHEFYSIIRSINNYLANNLVNGNDIILPYEMGKLELRRIDITPRIVDGKLVVNKPIDWDRTLKLWYEDNEAFKQRTLIKVENNDLFKIFYNKSKAKFNNKCFYEFQVNRDIKQRLKKNIKLNRIDAFLCGKI